MKIAENAKELLLEEVIELKAMQSFDVEVDSEFWIEVHGIEEYNSYKTHYDWDNDYHVIEVRFNPFKNPFAGVPFI